MFALILQIRYVPKSLDLGLISLPNLFSGLCLLFYVFTSYSFIHSI
jgi:hypothetical protein